MQLLHYSFHCMLGDDTLLFDVAYEFVIEHADSQGRIYFPNKARWGFSDPPPDFRESTWHYQEVDPMDLLELEDLLLAVRLPLRSPVQRVSFLGLICDHHLRLSSGSSSLQVEWQFEETPFPWHPITKVADFFESIYGKYLEETLDQKLPNWRLAFSRL